MTACADTSPLCYLILIGEVELLGRLFGRVVVAEAVAAELSHEDAPETVRRWVSNVPNWVRIHADPSGPGAGLERLQAGERAAILLAESVGGIVVLDEKAARRAALERGVAVTGTLGILVEAAKRGWVDFAPAIDRLRKTNFRVSPALLKAALDRFGR